MYIRISRKQAKTLFEQGKPLALTKRGYSPYTFMCMEISTNNHPERTFEQVENEAIYYNGRITWYKII